MVIQIIDLSEAEKTYCGPQKPIPLETIEAARQQIQHAWTLGMIVEHQVALAR